MSARPFNLFHFGNPNSKPLCFLYSIFSWWLIVRTKQQNENVLHWAATQPNKKSACPLLPIIPASIYLLVTAWHRSRNFSKHLACLSEYLSAVCLFLTLSLLLVIFSLHVFLHVQRHPSDWCTCWINSTGMCEFGSSSIRLYYLTWIVTCELLKKVLSRWTPDYNEVMWDK